jgi:fibronectin-binding autotransporter adhesin
MQSATSVVMTATTATSVLNPPVRYLFSNTVNGATSDWIPDTSWTNSGLTTFLTYGYKVKARDAYSNETAWSTSLPTVTLQADASGTWAVDASGNWGAPANWTTTPAGFVPDGVQKSAWLTNDITADRTVTVDATNRTLGVLNLGDADGSARFTLAATGGATLTFNNGGADALLNQAASSKGDAINGTLAITLDSSLVVSNAGVNALTLAGTLGGAGSLIKAGAGTVILSGANTYGGGTTIHEGTLLVNNGAGSGTGPGAVTVNAGGTLGGSGAISGSVTFGAGATNAPGAAAGATGTLTVNNSVTNAGVLAIDLNGNPTPACDTVVVRDNLDINGATLKLNVSASRAVGIYVIASYGTLTGSFAATNGLPDGCSLNYSYNSTNIAVIIVQDARGTIYSIR